MNRIFITMTALALSSTLVAAEVAKPASVLTKFDTDKNGSISEDEWAAAIEARESWIKEHNPRIFAKLDANGDGKITREERVGLRKSWESERKDRLDKNNDGKVGPGERRVADRKEDVKDRREDVKDRKEDVKDRREDKRDAAHEGGVLDGLEDILDKAEDRRDKGEDRRDRAEDRRDQPKKR